MMFDPERLIEKLKMQPNSMTPLQLVEAINQIAAETRRQAAPAYYVQRLGAIRILATLAAEKMGKTNNDC